MGLMLRFHFAPSPRRYSLHVSPDLSKPARLQGGLVAGLLMLKHMHNLSSEALCERKLAGWEIKTPRKCAMVLRPRNN